MDGNGRWSKQRLLGFRSENGRRPAEEVSILMALFLGSLEQEGEKLHENGIRFKTIGALTPFDSRIRELVTAGEAMTAGNTRLTLTVAANYGGRGGIPPRAPRGFPPPPRPPRR